MASPVLREQLYGRSKRRCGDQTDSGGAELRPGLLRLHLAGIVHPRSLSCLLDFMYTGQCLVASSQGEPLGSEGCSSLADLDLGPGLQQQRQQRQHIGLSRLAQALGLGVVSSLLKGRVPVIGQGLPPLGPQLERLLPCTRNLSALRLSAAERGSGRGGGGGGAISSQHAGLHEAESLLGGETVPLCSSPSGTQAPCPDASEEMPSHAAHQSVGDRHAEEDHADGAHAPLSEVLRSLAVWQQMHAGSLPSAIAVSPEDKQEEEDRGPEAASCDLLIAAPLPLIIATEDDETGSNDHGVDDDNVYPGEATMPTPAPTPTPRGDVCVGSEYGSPDLDVPLDVPSPARSLRSERRLPAHPAGSQGNSAAVLLLPAHGVVLAARCEYFRALLHWDASSLASGRRRRRLEGLADVTTTTRRVLTVPEADMESAVLLQVGLHGYMCTGRPHVCVP